MPRPTLLAQVLAIDAALFAAGEVAAVTGRVPPLALAAIGVALLAAQSVLLLRRQARSAAEARAASDRLRAQLEAERRAAGIAAIRAQERERQRLAQDLHDEVNQALTAIALRLEASIQEASPHLREELRDTKALATQAMEELLRLARQLRPAVLDDHGLMPALHTQVRDFTEQTGIRTSFHHQGVAPRLSPEQQLAIYRVTQESLSNIAQHAGASNVRVELSFVGTTVLRISDDGRGFAQRRDGGLGLGGMRERAMLAGGHLSIWSQAGSGTRVELTIR